MATKKVNTRVMNKCDLDENWRLATNFTPKKGELIIYQNCAEPATSTNYVTGNTKFKIGDGTTKVGDLPFQADGANSYEVVELTTSQTTLTNEQYTTLIASPFNKIKRGTSIYDLQKENTTSLVYTNNYLNEVKRLTINKTTLQITTGEFTLPNGHYTAKIVVGDNSSSTNNASTTNGNTYIKLVDGGVRRSYHKIQGGGATTVTSDKAGNVTIHSSSPFLSLGLGQTTYPITGEFTEEQGNKLLAAPFSTITFSPGGSPDSVPMLPQTSEQSHYSYIWKGSDANYTYTINATLNRTSDSHGGLVWMSKSYTITRETKSSTVTSVNGQTGTVVIDIPEGATAISTEDINAICSQVILNSEDVDL